MVHLSMRASQHAALDRLHRAAAGSSSGHVCVCVWSEGRVRGSHIWPLLRIVRVGHWERNTAPNRALAVTLLPRGGSPLRATVRVAFVAEHRGRVPCHHLSSPTLKPVVRACVRACVRAVSWCRVPICSYNVTKAIFVQKYAQGDLRIIDPVVEKYATASPFPVSPFPSQRSQYGHVLIGSFGLCQRVSACSSACTHPVQSVCGAGWPQICAYHC